MKNNLILVKGGSFIMGTNEFVNFTDESPAHKVILDDFYISKYLVTFEEYMKYCELVNKEKPDSSFSGIGKAPVVDINWFDAVEYAKYVGGRLPTEAEWEFACIGGILSKGFIWSGSNSDDIITVFRYDNKNVGEKAPNELGIYDMSSNFWEWCNDWYGENYYNLSPLRNPTGPSKGEEKVIRGGTYAPFDVGARCKDRSSSAPHISSEMTGFRIVFDL